MSETLKERAKDIVLLAIKELRTISASYDKDPLSEERAMDAWRDALFRRLHPLMSSRPESYFADAEQAPNLRLRHTQYVRRLQQLLVGLAQEQQKLLRDTEADGVFIVHGWDEKNLLRLSNMLQKDFGVRPVVMKDAPGAAATLIEKLEALAHEVRLVLVLWTLDDMAQDGKGQKQPQPRPNVLFETGFFIGRLGRAHVCVLAKGGVGKPPTDLSGVQLLPFQDNVEEIGIAIRRELQNAGLASS